MIESILMFHLLWNIKQSKFTNIVFDIFLSVILKPDINQQTENNVSGIWYAGIVVFGKEYAFSQAGVESTRPVRF